jgi:hypothetical protein
MIKLNRWSLYLDDEKSLHASDEPWKIARTVDEAKALIQEFGMPHFMSLGESATSVDFVKWLVASFYDYGPPAFVVHSANTVGKKNITSYLRSWEKAVSETASTEQVELEERPGTKSARAKGCKCPVMDNSYGLGRGCNGYSFGWYISEECKLHGTK